ncbi:hypothetical protein [Paraburkholderia graminis]|uniref:Uncharacterized protein n=1 Tax=Paraburkholderia graminis TaxID=60548 RepID=A0ABD5CRY9_9BURK|nr:hypothetical protein [Paraburkholderia graminis]MDR6208099.1 hypothetical protein [Paraburkholderia graminis]
MGIIAGITNGNIMAITTITVIKTDATRTALVTIGSTSVSGRRVP